MTRLHFAQARATGTWPACQRAQTSAGMRAHMTDQFRTFICNIHRCDRCARRVERLLRRTK